MFPKQINTHKRVRTTLSQARLFIEQEPDLMFPSHTPLIDICDVLFLKMKDFYGGSSGMKWRFKMLNNQNDITRFLFLLQLMISVTTVENVSLFRQDPLRSPV